MLQRSVPPKAAIVLRISFVEPCCVPIFIRLDEHDVEGPEVSEEAAKLVKVRQLMCLGSPHHDELNNIKSTYRL